MSAPVVLFLLRLLSAALLLAFLVALVWLVRRDLQQATPAGAQSQRAGTALLLGADGAVTSRFALRAVTSIGRIPGNTIVLDAGYVSAEHALLTLRDGRWWLEDLQSRNGTRLNNTRVTGVTRVSDGDIIAIGDTHLKLELPHE